MPTQVVDNGNKEKRWLHETRSITETLSSFLLSHVSQRKSPISPCLKQCCISLQNISILSAYNNKILAIVFQLILSLRLSSAYSILRSLVPVNSLLINVSHSPWFWNNLYPKTENIRMLISLFNRGARTWLVTYIKYLSSILICTGKSHIIVPYFSVHWNNRTYTKMRKKLKDIEFKKIGCSALVLQNAMTRLSIFIGLHIINRPVECLQLSFLECTYAAPLIFGYPRCWCRNWILLISLTLYYH